jgi:hypothetical protein
VLGVGMIAACLLAVVVLVDATAAFLQRQQLFALADTTALAGAQAIDLASYYEHGASEATRLDAAGVPGRVKRHLEGSGSWDVIRGLTLDEVRSDGEQVVVSLSAPLTLPFLSELFPGRVRVESRARLAYRGIG